MSQQPNQTPKKFSYEDCSYSLVVKNKGLLTDNSRYIYLKEGLIIVCKVIAAPHPFPRGTSKLSNAVQKVYASCLNIAHPPLPIPPHPTPTFFQCPSNMLSGVARFIEFRPTRNMINITPFAISRNFLAFGWLEDFHQEQILLLSPKCASTELTRLSPLKLCAVTLRASAVQAI